MVEQSTDTLPSREPPVVLDYASTKENTGVSKSVCLIVVIVAVVSVLAFALVPTPILDACWPLSAVAGIGLMLLGAVFFSVVERSAKQIHKRKFILSGILLSGMGAVTLCSSVLSWTTTTHCRVSPRTACAQNMRAVGIGLYLCAQDEADGAFPDDIFKPVTENQITYQTLFCPNDKSGNVSYRYIPGYGVNSNPNQIIMYEDPSNHGGEGGNVLYQDGHVSFVKSPKLEQLIDAITLPDGSP